MMHWKAAFVAGAVAASLSNSAAFGDPRGLPKPYTGPPITMTSPGARSPWIRLPHQPSFAPGSLLLLSDGSVLVDEEGTSHWAELVPNRRGSYVHGHWHRIASLPGRYAPMYYASAVLPDGRVVVAGGEYDGPSEAQVETNRGAIYDPRTNSWMNLPPPPGWSSVGDAQSTVLTDGRLLMADSTSSNEALLDPRTLTWTSTGAGKRDPNSQEGFSLLPDGRVLTVDTTVQGSELFDPKSGAWSSAGEVPVNLIGLENEQGPLVSGPDGTVLAVGGTGHTALYHSSAGRPGRWTAGPDIPRGPTGKLVAADAAGARLPNGDVLIDASPPGQHAPVFFFRFNGRRFIAVDSNGTARKVSSWNTRMLVLPTGQILYDDQKMIYVFRAGGSPPRNSWRPRIAKVARRLARGQSYRLSGRQLAGRDQGAAYGDDFQDDTNYPLVRIVNLASGVVTYARTYNWSSVSTAPGARSTTRFKLPHRMPLGRSTLVVIANGIASRPVTVTIVR